MALLKSFGWWFFLCGGIAMAAAIGIAWYVGHMRRERERENQAWQQHAQWLQTSNKPVQPPPRKSRF